MEEKVKVINLGFCSLSKENTEKLWF